MKILQNGKEVDKIDLGEVKIGESKTYTFTLENDSVWTVKDIELSLMDIDNKPVTEIKFIDYPSKMIGHSKSPLKFIWKPTTEIKKGLKTQLKISVTEIWT